MFVRVAEPRSYAPLFYIRTRCSSAVNMANLRSDALENVVGKLHCPAFVRGACLPSSSLTYVCMRCRTSLLRTSILHSYILYVCHHYRWLHSYALLTCRQHHRTPFVRIAEPHWYVPLSYVGMRCTSAVYIADLCSYVLHVCCLHRNLHLYALQNLIGIHRCPTFVRAACLPSTSPTYVRTCCTSAVYIADLRSYALLFFCFVILT